jgi:hypothetical protein
VAVDYKGVNWNRQHQKWIATIKSKGVSYHCGTYSEQVDAVKARDLCIIKNGLGIDKLQILKPKTL